MSCILFLLDFNFNLYASIHFTKDKLAFSKVVNQGNRNSGIKKHEQ